MKHLGISGGGTKIVGLGALALKIIEKGYSPDIISGVSAGAILALPLSMKKYKAIDDEIRTLDESKIFGYSLYGKCTKISLRALWSLISGKSGLTNMKGLEKTLKRIIKEDEFYKWREQANSEGKKCIVGTVDFASGSRIYHELNLLDYQTAIKMIAASASIPGAVSPVQYKGMYLMDGGVRDHSPSAWVLENYGISKHVSLYSRPENHKLDSLNWKPKNIIDIAGRYIDIVNIEVSKNDEEREREFCDSNGIKHKFYFLPTALNSVYDLDPKRLSYLYDASQRLYNIDPLPRDF